MKSIIRKTLSIVMIMLMIITYTVLAYAEDSVPEEPASAPEQTETVQAEPAASEPAPAASEPAPAASEPAADVAQTEPAASEPAAESAADISQAEPESAESPSEAIEPDPESAADEEEAAEQADAEEPDTAPEDNSAAPEEKVYVKSVKNAGPEPEKSITIGDTTVNGNADASGSGWIYDKASDTITLREFDSKADIYTDGRGVTIVTSGLNRIGTLSVDGQIDVIGSGILLIDSLEMAENCDFNLLPVKDIYGADGGSAAVFVLQEDMTYKLINGTVTGVIDEEIDLPGGTTLVMPENSSLELMALIRKTVHDEEGNIKETSYHKTSFAPGELADNEKLTYYGGYITVSNIVMKAGSSIINNVIDSQITCGLLIQGDLENNGTVSGGNIQVLGDYSGNGKFVNAEIRTFKDQEMSISIENSKLVMAGSFTVKELNNSGKSKVVFCDDSTINRIIMSSSDDYLEISGGSEIRKSKLLKLTESLARGTVFIGSGRTEISSGYKFIDGGNITLSNQDSKFTGAAIFNYSGAGGSSDGISGPVFLGPSDITVPAKDSIPAVSLYLLTRGHVDGSHSFIENKNAGEIYEQMEDYDATADDALSYEKLAAKYKPEDVMFVLFELLSIKDGKISINYIADSDPNIYDNEGVFLIRMACWDNTQDPAGGGAVTSTMADRTGAGTIGGNSTSVYKGAGLKRKQAEDPDTPDKPDPPKPIDPDKPDPPKPIDPDDPDDPDPVKPKSTASVAVSDVLALLINEYDLNEGTGSKEAATYYTLTAYLNGGMITELDGPVEVSMPYTLPEEFKDKPLYVVFANEDEDSDELLSAVNAEFDEETGRLTFETSQLGEFVIAALEFEGEEFSPEFYDELEKTDAVQPLIEILKEKSENAGL